MLIDKYIISYQIWNQSTSQQKSHGNISLNYDTERNSAGDFFNCVCKHVAQQGSMESADRILITGVFKL
jgi:hypothetical protein